MLTSPKQRLNWSEVLEASIEIIALYDTLVTLRQLFYRLVAAVILPNTTVAYKTLSQRSAKARREGWFPSLIDRTRQIHRFQTFVGPGEAQDWLQQIYRRDRTEGQEFSVYLGVEKAGIVEQLSQWFGDYGIPILALGGYSSQSYVDVVCDDIHRQGRPAVLIYAGDFDPSGEDIDRDFLARTGCFDKVVRVALTADQVKRYDLPEQMGKPSDSRARRFVEKHGRLVQVELDALPPDLLQTLYDDAIARFWDVSAFEASLARERAEAASLRTSR